MDSFNDLEIIKIIIEISKSLIKKYCDLYDLEISKLDYTYRYNDIIAEIKELKEEEQDIYNSLSSEVISKILFGILKIYNPDSDEMVFILNKDYKKNIVLERIYKLLKDRIKDIKASEKGNDIICIDLGKEVVTDTLAGCLTNIQEKINTIDNEELRNELIKYKYFLLYSEPSLEERYLPNKFIIEDRYYAGSKAISQLFRISESDYENVLLKINYGLSHNQISKIFITNDDEIDDDKAKYLIRQYIIISCFQSLNKEDIEDLKTELINYMYELQQMVSSNRNQHSINCLFQIFENYQNKKYQKLELSLIK